MAALACLFCGAEGPGVLPFFAAMAALAIGGTALALAWSVARGDFRETERAKRRVLMAEGIEAAEEEGAQSDGRSDDA
jgi:hypothetical protein